MGAIAVCCISEPTVVRFADYIAIISISAARPADSRGSNVVCPLAMPTSPRRKKFQVATFCTLGHFKIQIRTEASELGHHLTQPAPPDFPRASKLSGCEPSGVSSHFVQVAQIMAAAASTSQG
jgi:hypothetical protein